MTRRRAPLPKDPARVDGRRIDRVLAELGYDPNAPALRLLKVWESAVGPEIAAHCEPTNWEGGTLELTVASPVWAQQVSLRTPLILAGLRSALGSDAPTNVRTRVRGRES